MIWTLEQWQVWKPMNYSHRISPAMPGNNFLQIVQHIKLFCGILAKDSKGSAMVWCRGIYGRKFECFTKAGVQQSAVLHGKIMMNYCFSILFLCRVMCNRGGISYDAVCLLWYMWSVKCMGNERWIYVSNVLLQWKHFAKRFWQQACMIYFRIFLCYFDWIFALIQSKTVLQPPRCYYACCPLFFSLRVLCISSLRQQPSSLSQASLCFNETDVSSLIKTCFRIQLK